MFFLRVFVQSNLSVKNQLSIYDVIVDQKSSSREGKFTFYGWGYSLTSYDVTKKACYEYLADTMVETTALSDFRIPTVLNVISL